MLNVMLNAMEAMEEGGTLTVSLAGEGDHVVVRFADTGPGIPAEEIDKIVLPVLLHEAVRDRARAPAGGADRGGARRLAGDPERSGPGHDGDDEASRRSEGRRGRGREGAWRTSES